MLRGAASSFVILVSSFLPTPRNPAILFWEIPPEIP